MSPGEIEKVAETTQEPDTDLISTQSKLIHFPIISPFTNITYALINAAFFSNVVSRFAASPLSILEKVSDFSDATSTEAIAAFASSDFSPAADSY